MSFDVIYNYLMKAWKSSNLSIDAQSIIKHPPPSVERKPELGLLSVRQDDSNDPSTVSTMWMGRQGVSCLVVESSRFTEENG